MATFRKRSNAWQVRIQRSGYPDQSKTFKTRAEALAWARHIEAELDKGVSFCQTKRDQVVLKELLEKYLNEVTHKKKHSDVEGYRVKAWMKHPISERPVTSIKGEDIARWRDERLKLGKSPNTIRLELSVLSNLFNLASSEWGFESLTNPTTKIKLPKLPSGRARRLGDDELQRIILNSDSEFLKDIVIFAVETAMRRGEIVSIEWSNVNLKKRTVLIPFTKNGESREIPLSPLALSVLQSLPHHAGGKVFDITAHAITIAFGRACKRAGLNNLHFHDLRHEAVSRLFERGFSLPEVATISGHKTWTMLRRYTHLSAEKIAQKLAA